MKRVGYVISADRLQNVEKREIIQLIPIDKSPISSANNIKFLLDSRTSHYGVIVDDET